MSADIGIDLGTASVLVFIKGKGVVLKEPSVVALDRDTKEIKAIGEEARLMLGRTPGNIIAIRPLEKGVVSDYTVTEKMIKYFVQKSLGRRMLKKPRISICVPCQITEVEQKAVEEAAYAAGAREVCLVEEPVAAAIGAGLDIMKPFGNMIVDIGGGTTDVAVISLGAAVVHTSVKTAGNDFDEAIARYMRKKQNLLVGDRTAEEIKIKVGTVYPLEEELEIEIRGRNLVTGLPKTVTVTSSETESSEGSGRPNCRVGDTCTGADTTGIVSGYFGAWNYADRRRCTSAGDGYTDGGEDGNPDDGSRRSDESCCSGKWTICRSYWDEKKFLVRFRFYKKH